MTSLRFPMLRQMRGIPAATAILLASYSPMYCQAAQPGNEIIGKWKFTKVLDLAEMASIDEHGARQLLGHVMTIRKDGARFDGEVCQPSDFETKRVEPNLYLQQEAGVGNSKLRLPSPVTVIDISCTQVYVKKPNRAVIFWNGFFFEAVRVSR
ncbi:hypothetical protein [Massilia horti]|uniref:DUF2147 domain-containing protein n=1 Tax=Massilia horti TaxID=2562153 RepID=A0A4Y9T3J2_9BURK|nr:hypothetical protein [Massilia horti]TFW34278.1 hypothetical protein E4O92_04350 [Massilia horti]